MDFPAIHLPDDLRGALRDRGWSQKQLADAAGLSEPAVSHICNGLRPTPRAAAKIAEALGEVSETWDPPRQATVPASDAVAS
jgi:transcriptional regulator with XRE-family HTH domain